MAKLARRRPVSGKIKHKLTDIVNGKRLCSGIQRSLGLWQLGAFVYLEMPVIKIRQLTGRVVTGPMPAGRGANELQVIGLKSRVARADSMEHSTASYRLHVEGRR